MYNKLKFVAHAAFCEGWRQTEVYRTFFQKVILIK